LKGHLTPETICFIGDFLDRGLSWFGGLLRHTFVECLNVGVGHGSFVFFFHLRGGVRGIGVLAGFDRFHDANRVVLGELDSPRNLRVQFSPYLAELEKYRSRLECIRCLPGSVMSVSGSEGERLPK
jgi:hypothetical protein